MSLDVMRLLGPGGASLRHRPASNIRVNLAVATYLNNASGARIARLQRSK